MAVRRDFYTGLFVLLAGGVLLGAYLYSSLIHFTRNTQTFIVDAKEVAGLEVGTDVQMGGLKLGTIRKITVLHDPQLHFELEIRLTRDVPIIVGTRAVIASRSLAGGRILDLRPPARGHELLKEGSTIPAETDPAIQDILNKADYAFANLAQITTDMRRFVSSEKGSGGLAETLDRLNRALTDLDLTAKSANSFIKNLDQTAARLSPPLETSVQSLDRTMKSADQAMARLDKMLEKEGPAVDALLKKADARLEELKALSVLLAGYDPQKNKDIRETLRHLNGATRNLEELLADLKKHPWKVIRKDKTQAPAAPATKPAPSPPAAPEPASTP